MKELKNKQRNKKKRMKDWKRQSGMEESNGDLTRAEETQGPPATSDPPRRLTHEDGINASEIVFKNV
jgi:hypothetical protein